MDFIQTIQNHTPGLEILKGALKNALSLGVPTKKLEEWKYTNLEKYLPEFDLEKQKDFAASVESADGFRRIVFLNGKLDGKNSDLAPELLGQDNEKRFSELKNKLGELLSKDFAAQLSEASPNQYFLELSEESETPILITHIYSGANAKHSSANLNILGKANSETHILEEHISQDPSETFANNGLNVYLENNARLHFTKLQNVNKESSNVQNIRAIVSRDANFESITVDIGAKLSRNTISIEMTGEGAQASAHGLCAIAGEQQSDTNSYIRHAKGHTESFQLFKGLMNDKAHGIFSGVIRMDKDAQLCNSEQLNKNLLLSKGAHAHSRPQLEIFADDVKAAHGSTTGQLSDEELFYFQSRGVSTEKAKRLLAQAFLNDVLLKIKNQTARARVQELVSQNFKALTVG